MQIKIIEWNHYHLIWTLLYCTGHWQKQRERRGEVNGLSNGGPDGCINLSETMDGKNKVNFSWVVIMTDNDGCGWGISTQMISQQGHDASIRFDFWLWAWPQDDHLICYSTLQTFYFILKKNRYSKKKYEIIGKENNHLNEITRPEESLHCQV